VDVLLFGEAQQPLLGVYHPAEAQCDLRRGIVFCYPFGQEYMRSHRALRLLADTLARKGYHVFRFDYRGTGDSAGTLEGFSPNDWLDDIEAAVQELRDIAGLQSIGMLGLRLGALLAKAVAARRSDIEQLLLWDPIVSGADYLAELQREIDSKTGNPKSNFLAENGDLHFNGFCLSHSFQATLRKLDVVEPPPAPATRVAQFVSHESAEFARMRAAYRDRDGYAYHLVAAPHDWNYVDHVGGILLPQPIMTAIANSL
jgi:pimeloyl-ACP methyl ester carboxylesterase